MKVAMEEASRIRARCFPIDEDIDVTLEKISKVFSWVLLWKQLSANASKDYTRASYREYIANERKNYPEFVKVVDDDREKFMFEKIRTFRKNVVAVVGMGHMDGIELLWKHAEEDMLLKRRNVEEGDNNQHLSSKKKKHNKQRRHQKKKNAVAMVTSNQNKLKQKLCWRL
ncbi:uncharacterized protein LOC113309222 [Papaver somniferum]|uniref:uncharacterized protein LOC113309222 n=1 Tax=Papaver somniferum TaxID=3469 RepID=UPI000E6F4A7A|nr:uncharacterized protein LOC113309222 [Papaver somniferum]